MRVLLPPDRDAGGRRERGAALSGWMASWLESSVEVSFAANYRELLSAVEDGRADLVWAPPAICARIRSGVRSMLTAVRNGATTCSAALVVKKSGGPGTLAELRGKRASWVDPLSTCGHLLALAHLHDRDLDAGTLFETQRFAGTYRDAILDVAEGRADVTSMYVIDDDEATTLREMERVGSVEPDGLRVLCTTAPAPYDALIIGEQAPDWERLQARILELERANEPRSTLLEFCVADRFVRAHAGGYARFERFVEPFLD